MKCKTSFYASTAMAVLVMGGFAVSAMPAAAQESGVETVVVLGVRGAEQKAIDLKRTAITIQDSIAAEDIGKLPDVTISDSLQRITGVQIDRSAGEGSAVNIRGLPQVGTLLNGEDFVTSNNIVGVQPNFTDIPSSLFAGADVIKSPTASLIDNGITGTVNLRTRRPSDLNEGWTVAGTLNGTVGTIAHKWDPEANALVGYNAGRWGILATLSYSDVTNENSHDGMDQYGGNLMQESASEANNWNGILTQFSGDGINPLPSDVHVLGAGCTPTNYNSGSCSVDVDGDGHSNSAFYNSENFTALDREVERNRLGFSTSLQAELGHGLRMTADFFYTNQDEISREVGWQLNSHNWLGQAMVPKVFTPTDATVNGLVFNTTQVYEKYIGDMETYSQVVRTWSQSHNYNLELAYDEGGDFTAEARVLYASATQLQEQSYLQFTFSNGNQWCGGAVSSAATNCYYDPVTGNAGYYFPASAGGNRIFNPYGRAATVDPVLIDTRGDHLAVTLPSALQADTSNIAAYAFKSASAETDYDRRTSMLVYRADGHYKFQEGVKVDFGIRSSHRAADNVGFNMQAPYYGGNGAYDFTSGTGGAVPFGMAGVGGSASSTGCYVHWKAGDVVLDGGGATNGCSAGDGTHFYHANPLAGLNPTQLPDVIKNNMKVYNKMAGVTGITLYELDPKVMDNPNAFHEALWPGEIRDVSPAQTWHVDLAQLTGYAQANIDGQLYFPFQLNAGLRVVKTDLTVYTHKLGAVRPYGLNPLDGGTVETDRSFTDALPAANLGFDLRDDVKLRMAYSKNMQLLNLDQWGGGVSTWTSITGTGRLIQAGGSSAGNPNLDPWRSTNYDMSVEYYYGKGSMINVAIFYIDVASFISNATVLHNVPGKPATYDIANADGTYTDNLQIGTPVQGKGSSLKGVELGIKQAFDFLPGFWGNFGAEFNFTYSPSNTGTDMAGNKIPFQDNSSEQMNAILWYQDEQFQARVAGNYRSKRAVSANFGGISGLEQYQKPTFYLDASASYDFSPSWQVFVQGSNLLGEEEHYFLTWTDQLAGNTRFEPRVTFGVRARF
jgi:TonB-dependent receptor